MQCMARFATVDGLNRLWAARGETAPWAETLLGEAVPQESRSTGASAVY